MLNQCMQRFAQAFDVQRRHIQQKRLVPITRIRECAVKEPALDRQQRQLANQYALLPFTFNHHLLLMLSEP